MKKLIVALPLFLTVIFAYAQNLSFGVIGGIGHSWTSVDKISGTDTRLHANYSIGGRLVYSFESSWGVSGDVKFSSEGHTVGISNKTKTVTRANYIRIPIQAIYFFGEFGDRVRPKISLGPSFGILAGGKIKTYVDGDRIARLKTKDYLKTFDFGFTAAAGGNVRIAPSTWLNLDLSYYLGLADVTDIGADGGNRNLGINVGVTFPLATLRPERVLR